MPDGDREYMAGWLIVEDWRLPWNARVSDPSVKIMGVGEMGHARWTLFIEAWREVCRRDLRKALQAMADRAGIK